MLTVQGEFEAKFVTPLGKTVNLAFYEEPFVCGIVAFVGREDAWPIIFEGLQRLEYRGYDSAGIAVIDDDGELQFRKTVGKVIGLNSANGSGLLHGSAGLGHTRWATHGKPSQANAHPHTDCHHRVAVVHNGIVENYLELKRQLQAAGHQFASETDTEVITHLVEDGMDMGLSFEDSILRMGHAIKGSQAITAMLQGQEGKICAMRLGHAGGIVVAHADGQGIVGSDLPAVLPILKRDPQGVKVGFLESGEMAVVTREGVDYRDLDGNRLDKGLRTVSPEEIVIDKGGHRHFMLREIMEQPQAVTSALRERVDFAAGRVELSPFFAGIKRPPAGGAHRLWHQSKRGHGGPSSGGNFGRAAGRGRERIGISLSGPLHRCSDPGGVHWPVGRDSRHAGRDANGA